MKRTGGRKKEEEQQLSFFFGNVVLGDIFFGGFAIGSGRIMMCTLFKKELILVEKERNILRFFVHNSPFVRSAPALTSCSFLLTWGLGKLFLLARTKRISFVPPALPARSEMHFTWNKSDSDIHVPILIYVR